MGIPQALGGLRHRSAIPWQNNRDGCREYPQSRRLRSNKVSGENIAQGYWNRPEETRQIF